MIRQIVCRFGASRQQSASPSGHWIGGWGYGEPKEHNRDQTRTLNCRRVLILLCVSSIETIGSTSCVESNLERLAEGFGFVQSCLRPQSGVTWLGCDAAVQQCRGASTRCRFDALSSQSRPDDDRCGDYAVCLKHGRQDTSFMQF